MRTKVVLLVTTLVFLLASVATGFAQQNPPAQAGGGGRGGQAGGGGQGAGGGRGGQAPPPFAIMSPSITDGTALAVKYSCAAGPAAISPEIRWANPPRDVASYVLIVHDMEPRPRKGVDDFLHWMVWNIPMGANKLPEAAPSNTPQLPDGSFQTNGAPGQGGIVGYRPPCAPAGPSHHYAFELFALDQTLDVPATATRADVMKAMDGHISAHAALIVLYHQ